MEKNIISRNLVIAACAAVAAAAIIIVNGLIIENQEVAALQNSFVFNTSTVRSFSSGTSSSSPHSPSKTDHGATTVTPQPPFTITLLTPTAGETWRIGKSNSISWSRAANVSGEIDLIDAVTGKLAGVITSDTGPQQTSYSWDTRQIYLERYGALKKDITPGSYSIQLKFDGNNLPNIASGAVRVN